MAPLQSILQFINKEKGTGAKEFYQLYDTWKDGLDKRVKPFRKELDTWFMKCYSVICKNISTDTEKDLSTEDALKQEFDETISASILQVEADRVLQNMDFGDFVNLVVECVEVEQQLIIDYNEEKAERLVWEQIKQRISEAEQSLQYLKENIQSFQTLFGVANGQVVVDEDQLKTICQNVQTKMKDLYQYLVNLTSEMKTEIQKWLKALQLQHAELAVPCDLNKRLQNIKECCGQVGKLVYDVRAMLQDQHCAPAVHFFIGDGIHQKIQEIFHDFLSSSFIVTEQESFCVRTLKRNFPKFEVSVLAASLIPRREVVEVRAIFVSEYHIKDGNFDDINSLDCCNQELLSATQTLKQGTSQWIFTFKELKFKGDFKRKPPCRDQKQVHEEKYRILFQMSYEKRSLTACSLPLVVIKASNQEAKALASITWQCHSTNVFEFPVNIPEKIPWSIIAEMLQLKMMKLTTHRTLTEENLSHLKRKLYKKDCGEGFVTLQMLLQNSEKNTVEAEHKKKKMMFSFWEWFLGVYNLIEQYLLPYWRNGLILGFISKNDAIRKLENESKLFGTFILRFADTKLDYKDGIKEVFGCLAAAIRIKETKSVKRKFGEQLNRKLIFKSVDVANCTDLEDSLANILMTTRPSDGKQQALYSYVYPSNGSTKTMFGRVKTNEQKNEKAAIDDESLEDTTIDNETDEEANIGYVKPKWTKTVDIQTKFEEMNIDEDDLEDETSGTKRARLDQNTPATESQARQHCAGCTCSVNRSLSAPMVKSGDTNVLRVQMSSESLPPDPIFNATPQTQFFVPPWQGNNSDTITSQDMNGTASPELQNATETNASLGATALPEDIWRHVEVLNKYLSAVQQHQLVDWLQDFNNGKQCMQQSTHDTYQEINNWKLSDDEIVDGLSFQISDSDDLDFDFLNTS